MKPLYVFSILIFLFFSCSKIENIASKNNNDLQSLSKYELKELGEESSVTYDNKFWLVLKYSVNKTVINFRGQPFLDLEIGLEKTISLSIDGKKIAKNGLAFAKISGKNYTSIESSLERIDTNIDVLEITFMRDGTPEEETFKMSIRFDYRHTKRGNSQIKVVNGEARISGKLGLETYNQVLMLNKNHPTITTLNFVDIQGSLDHVNHETGRLIREAGYTTKIDSKGNVQGGGIDLFCAGKKRKIVNGAFLKTQAWCCDNQDITVPLFDTLLSNQDHSLCCEGFEEVHLRDLFKSAPSHNDRINYFNEMLDPSLGEQFYFFIMTSKVLTQEYIKKFKIATD